MIRSFLSKCAGVLVLIDAPRAESGESDEDFHTMKLISYLCELASRQEDRLANAAGRRWSSPRPTSASTASTTRPAFAHRHTPGLVPAVPRAAEAARVLRRRRGRGVRLPQRAARPRPRAAAGRAARHRRAVQVAAGGAWERRSLADRRLVELWRRHLADVDDPCDPSDPLAGRPVTCRHLVMRLEQAIFTSVRSERLDGYQLAARSSGVTDELAKELTGWGPAHDSLWVSEPGCDEHQLSRPLRRSVSAFRKRRSPGPNTAAAAAGESIRRCSSCRAKDSPRSPAIRSSSCEPSPRRVGCSSMTRFPRTADDSAHRPR